MKAFVRIGLPVLATFSLLSYAQSKDITNEMPRVEKGKLTNTLPKPADKKGPVKMNADGTQGNIPISKNTDLYGAKDKAAKPGELKVQGGVEIKTK